MQNNIKNKTNLRSFKMKNRNIGDADDNSTNAKLTTNSTPTPFQRIQKVINKHNGIDLDKITSESELRNGLNLDSLDIVEIVSKLEEEFQDFNIKISDEDMDTIKTVEDVHNLINTKISQQ